MHAEYFSISAEAAAKINDAGRIIAVGNTTVRELESAKSKNGRLLAQEGSTDLFIYPPDRFRAVDLLLTNFHLPRSTLLMLISAFAGREFLLRAYQEAIRERYRFYSYGDCMLILWGKARPPGPGGATMRSRNRLPGSPPLPVPRSCVILPAK